jgi:hypothetical protein
VDLLHGFGLQLRDTYGAALCVSLHHPSGKGDHLNVHGHIFTGNRSLPLPLSTLDADYEAILIRSANSGFELMGAIERVASQPQKDHDMRENN